MIKKPFYQILYERGAIMIAAIIIVSAFLNSFNLLSLISLKIATWITVVSVMFLIILQVQMKRRKINWVTKDGQKINLTRLGQKPSYSIFAMLILLWIYALSPLNYSRNIESSIFKSSDPSFKVLILPFGKECDFNNKNYDIGYVLNNRLLSLHEWPESNIKSHYLSSLTNIADLDFQRVDSLLRSNHADMVIYGSYSFKECESDNSDKVCFRYRTDTAKWILYEKQISVDTKMTSFPGLNAIRNGSGQEDIDFILYLITAYSFHIKGKFQKAFQLYRKIGGYENSELSLLPLANCCLHLKDFLAAEKYYMKAAKLNSKNVDSWNGLGIAYLGEKKYQDAKKIFFLALSINPNSEISMSELGGIYDQEGKHDSAIFFYKKALSLAPNSPLIWNNLALTYKNKKNYDSAKTCFQNAIYFDQKADYALNNLGVLYNDQGVIDSALFYFKKALIIDSTYEACLNNIGYVFQLKYDFDSAIQYYVRALRVDSTLVPTWINLANCYLSTNKIDQAKDCLKLSTIKNPYSIDLWFCLGSMYNKLKDYANEVECYKKGIKIDSTINNLWLYLGTAYLYMQNYPEAINSFRKDAIINPLNSQPYYYLGITYRNLRNYSFAKYYLEKATSLSPSDESYWALLGLMNHNLSNYSKAEKCFKKAISLNPKYDLANYWLAFTFSAKRNKNLVFKYLLQAILLNSQHKKSAQYENEFKWLWKDPEFINITRS